MCCSVLKCINDCKVLIITFFRVILCFTQGRVVDFSTIVQSCPWPGWASLQTSIASSAGSPVLSLSHGQRWRFFPSSSAFFPSVSILCSKGSVMPSVQPQDEPVAPSSGATHTMYESE